MEKASNLVKSALNSNAAINAALVGTFGLLSFRSFAHQKEIQTLESERDELIKSNKIMMKSMWDWKQQLYAEAEKLESAAVIPLTKLKLIYGEVVVTPQIGNDAANEETKSPGAKFVV